MIKCITVAELGAVTGKEISTCIVFVRQIIAKVCIYISFLLPNVSIHW